MTRRRLPRLLAAATGDDGTGGRWERLTSDGREVMRLAFLEARELGHPCLADEHVLLGLLRQDTSQAAALLRAAGLDLATARAELLRVGPTLGPTVDPSGALRSLGIEVAQVRQRLEATFGAPTVYAAERRVRRRPRWRGGHARPSPLCVHLLAKRSLQIAAQFADRRGDGRIGPDDLLYGVLHDARDPLGTQLSRRSRRQLAGLGWTQGRPNPLRLLLEARGIDLTRLAADLLRASGMLVSVALAVGLTGCTSGGRTDDPSITVSPATALLDQPVKVSMVGLGANRRATVTATAKDVAGVTWSSSADFRAGGDGTLSLGQAPVGGSYSGVNPMGLFQFMVPDDPRSRGFGAPLSGTYDVRLEVKVDERTVAAATATRTSPLGAGVTAKSLTVPTDGVYGVLYRPKDTGTKKPALLVFGGSEGGLSYPVQLKSALLAAHGYPTLALAYFKAPGLPRDLAAIPLEYFRKALTILRTQPGVDTDHVLVTGASWGGEGSLLVAATYPDLVSGVIAEVPNSYIDVAPFTKKRSSWTLHGKELPFAPSSQFGAPAAEVDRRAHIPVDHIRGPILLACGELDLEWPSCRNVDDIVGRLAGRPGVTVLRYRDAGHYVGVYQPYTSATDAMLTRTGGTIAGTQAASLDLHTKILALLASLGR